MEQSLSRSSVDFTSVLRAGLALAAAALALLWPAFVNGGPFWFPDTSNYIRAADAAVVALTGSPSEWSDRLVVAQTPAAAGPAAYPDNDIGVEPTRPVLGGRSIYYGFLLYLPMRFFGIWGAVFFQALLVAGVIGFCGRILVRELGGPSTAALRIGTLVLLILTPLPFYTAMLMPDVYTGPLILALAMVIALWPRLSPAERAGLLCIAAAIATFHTTHLLIAAAMGVGAAVFAPAGRDRMRPLLIVLPVLAAGVLSIAAFNMAVTRALGQPPISPPFLSARLTAAGPGTEYLRERCADQPDAWAMCRHLAKLPQWSDTFLWSEDPRAGVFQVADNAEKHRLAAEDKRFFLTVLAADPVGVASVSIENFGRQLVAFEMGGFNIPADRMPQIKEKYPPEVAADIKATLAAKGSFNVLPTITLTAVCMAGSIALLLFAWFGDRSAARGTKCHAWHLVALLIGGVVINAAITGAFSYPHGRYQMRLIWLLPLAAGIAYAGIPTRFARGKPLHSQRLG